MVSSLQVVLVTGASRGLGLAVARTLLAEGANVVSLSRSVPAELKALAQDTSSSTGAALVAVQGDVTSSEDTKAAVDQAVQKWGRLDGIVLNAGVVDFARLADVTPESFAQQIQVNLVSLVTTLHHAIPHLRASPTGLGRVVFVSSGASVSNTAGWAAYNASKAGLNAVARTLANEEPALAVWAVRPGVVDTDMAADIRNRGLSAMGETGHARFIKLHRDGALLPPEQPANVLATLAIRGTREEPKTPEGEGAGAKGAYIDWASKELAAFRLPETQK